MFPKDFLWGAASSSYQVEGAYRQDGKGLSIWDALTQGRIAHGENGQIACDHYNRYRQDVALMKQIGLKSYRFSVSWPRIIPAEDGRVNERGLQFYSDLVDELRAAGIEPMVTLYHWDLPLWAHRKGGWKNSAIADWFAAYTKVVVEALSDRVKYWITLNEPQYFMGFGYVIGQAAPYSKAWLSIPRIARNILLAHGKAVKTIRQYAGQQVRVGFAPTGQSYIPRSEDAEDIAFARAHTFGAQFAMFANTWWCDPVYLGRNMEIPKHRVLERLIALSDRELEEVSQPLDFCAFNVYNSTNYNEGKKPNPAVYPGMPRTAMNWPVTPEVLYWSTRFFYERYRLPILITENGMANCDFKMSDGKVHDPQRIDFMRGYLLQLQRAIDEGIPVMGYQYWSLMDNFEWGEGFDKRFGLIHVDYRTQERTPKDSAWWYREVIDSNAAIL